MLNSNTGMPTNSNIGRPTHNGYFTHINIFILDWKFTIILVIKLDQVFNVVLIDDGPFIKQGTTRPSERTL